MSAETTLKIKPTFKIKVTQIEENVEKEINEKIKAINNPHLNDFQKRILVLAQDKTGSFTVPNTKYNIDIKQIKKEREEEIEEKIKQIKEINLSYIQKRFLVLREEKTISYYVNEEEENIKKDQNEGSSTDGDSLDEQYKLDDNGLDINIQKKKKYKQYFKIDIKYLREQREKLILERMKKYNDPNMSELQKRILALREDKTTTIYIKNTENSEKIENNEDSNIINNLNVNNDSNILNNLNVNNSNNYNNISETNNSLDETNDTTIKNNSNIITNDKTKIDINVNNDKNYNNTSGFNNSLDETNDTTIKDNSNIIINEETKIDINEDYLNKSEIYYNKLLNNKNQSTLSKSMGNKNRFNSVRSEYCMKYKLYDIPLDVKDLDIYTPPKYIINEKYFAFLYPNNFDTYYISESGYLLHHVNDNKNDVNNKNEIKKYPKLGLYFCGETIEIQRKNEITNEICKPDRFMCRECMKINKKKYHIKDNYLININGRVAKINLGKYHCFGHFLQHNQIEDCISKFTCKACNILELYHNYYFPCEKK